VIDSIYIFIAEHLLPARLKIWVFYDIVNVVSPGYHQHQDKPGEGCISVCDCAGSYELLKGLRKE